MCSSDLRLRSQIWLCFVCLLYFLALVQAVLAYPDNALPVAQLVLVVALFVSGAFYVRWQARFMRADQGMVESYPGDIAQAVPDND